ncbi:MAG: IclR family transcriptional regulator [Fimbriimonadaceae bacterium]|jgi:IclR family acetate operon transcriptional repressor|nr:IclR family transcriptional regulator [Alphaproteobacteria bacterium]
MLTGESIVMLRTTGETKNHAAYKVKSLGRALDLLEALTQNGQDGLGLAGLSRSIGLSKPATYAILQTFLARGIVSDFGEGLQRRYRLGLALARMGEEALKNVGLIDVAMIELRKLSQDLQLTSRMAVFEDGHAIVVARVDGPGAVRFDSALGRRELPHCSAVGKALLAQKPDAEVRAILERLGMPQRTARTIVQIPRFLHELRNVRTNGFAIDDQEDSEGVACVASCVFNRTKPIAAISVTGLRGRNFSSRKNELAIAVMACAERISSQLG